MKFIFPQNFDFKNKLFGIIDYSTALLNLPWFLVIFLLLQLFPFSLLLKISLFIIFCLPIFLFSIIGFNHENIVYVCCYLFSYLKKPKLYLYSK